MRQPDEFLWDTMCPAGTVLASISWGFGTRKRGLNNCADDACECAQDAGLRDRATRRPARQPDARPPTCKIPSTGAHFNRSEHTVQRELRRSYRDLKMGEAQAGGFRMADTDNAERLSPSPPALRIACAASI